MLAFESAVNAGELDHGLLDLVRTRVSQINGCAFCLDMHTKDLRAAGETEQRLHTLAAWRDAPFYTAPERAALALAEAVTLVAGTEVPDALIDEARRHFSDAQIAQLIYAIGAINVWNRLNVVARPPVGGYVAAQHQHA